MFAQIARILTFRATLADFERLENRHLAAGLVAAWLVGVGRYWDNPRVGVLQHAGAGSVAYVFLLSALLCWPCSTSCLPSWLSVPTSGYEEMNPVKHMEVSHGTFRDRCVRAQRG